METLFAVMGTWIATGSILGLFVGHVIWKMGND